MDVAEGEARAKRARGRGQGRAMGACGRGGRRAGGGGGRAGMGLLNARRAGWKEERRATLDALSRRRKIGNRKTYFGCRTFHECLKKAHAELVFSRSAVSNRLN